MKVRTVHRSGDLGSARADYSQSGPPQKKVSLLCWKPARQGNDGDIGVQIGTTSAALFPRFRVFLHNSSFLRLAFFSLLFLKRRWFPEGRQVVWNAFRFEKDWK